MKASSTASKRSVRKTAGSLFRGMYPKRDRALVQRSLELMRPIIHNLTTALPATDPQLIGGIFADLLDLWETEQKLDRELHKLTKLRLPEDREEVRSTLIWIDAIQLDMASYWIRDQESPTKAAQGSRQVTARVPRCRYEVAPTPPVGCHSDGAERLPRERFPFLMHRSFLAQESRSSG